MLHSRLKDLRQRAGLSQPELAEKMKIGASMVSLVESGRRLPSLDLLNRWLQATDARMEIVGDSNDPLAVLGGEERQLIEHWRELDSKGRDVVLQIARLWKSLDHAHRFTLSILSDGWQPRPAPSLPSPPSLQARSKSLDKRPLPEE